MIAVIDYGAGNLRSIVNGLRKVGAEAEVVAEPDGLRNADAVVLPGVGSFGEAMVKLSEFKPAVKEFVDSGRPFLGLCLGIQVIFDSSEESPGAEGLGLFRGTCMRFTGDMKIPHMGWNTIKKVSYSPLLEGIGQGEQFYFVHSYYAVPEKESIVSAKTEYGVEFPSVITRDNIHATQFHPEKSGDQGLKVLENYVKLVKR